MIPIVKVDEEGKDKRKNKTLHWKEARLCLVHEAGSTTPTFGATFSGTVADAGKQPVWNETEYGEPLDKTPAFPLLDAGDSLSGVLLAENQIMAINILN